MRRPWWWHICRCGCARMIHQHLRAGTECANCGLCPRWRRAWFGWISRPARRRHPNRKD